MRRSICVKYDTAPLKRSSSGKRPSGNKRAKETSTVTASLKDVFFLMDVRDGIPKYEKRTRLVEERFVKSAVRFTSDMDEEAIFSTIRDQFDTKFDGNVPPFKILKAYGTKLVVPNMDSSWNYKVLKQQCGNGPIYVCPESITVSSDSEGEAYDLQEPKVMKKNYGNVRDESSHTLKHESAKSISKHAVHNPVLMKKVTCPVCQLKISSVEIEAHADNCAEKAASSTDYASIIVDIPPCLVTSDPELEDVELMQIQGYGSSETESLDGSVGMLRKVIKDDVSKLTKRVDEADDICRLSIGRLYAWKDYVSFFKKLWNKPKVLWPIAVTFLGEAAVDTGGPKREFFSGELLHQSIG